jgi:hypothetical protein
VALLAYANSQPHTSSLGEEGPAPSCDGAALTQAAATKAVAANFPADRLGAYRTITSETLVKVDAGDQAGAAARVTDLETAWDDDQATLQPIDCQAWTFVDEQIDPALAAVRASNPDKATEDQALQQLLDTLG